MPVTATSLTSGSSDVDGTSAVTASITPSSNKLVLLAVTSRWALGVGGPPTISGNGLTWVQVATRRAGALADGNLRVTVFRAMGSAPSSGTVTITFSDTQENFAWSIVEFGNVDTGGTNGSAAVVQSAVNGSDAATSLTVTLAAFGSADNATYGAFVDDHATENQTPGTGFTELHDVPVTTEANTGHTIWRNDNDTTVDQSSATAMWRGGVAVEIKFAAVGGSNRMMMGIGI